ncbi:MAG: ABC transporter ATP-binding protein [Anaerolineae bacterium]|nr:ABC transporter ATP-binding protein [Anaerolineae bacterium]
MIMLHHFDRLVAHSSMSLSLRHYGELLVTYLRPQKWKVATLAVLLVGNIALQLVSPRIVGAFLDAVQTGSPLSGLARLALLFLGMVFVGKAVLGAASYLSADIGWTAINALRADLADHCLSLDLSFHQTHTPGELIERIDGDVNALAEFFSTFVIYILSSVLMFGGAVACLATLVMFRFLHHAGVPYSRASRQVAADLSGFWAERLGGREDIRAAGAEAHALRRMHQLMRARLYRALQSQFMSGILVNSWFIIYTVGNGYAAAVGGRCGHTGRVDHSMDSKREETPLESF